MVIMCIALVIMIGAITYQVISRYFFNFSLVWAEELARCAFIWMVLLGLSNIELTDEPIRITAIRDLFPQKGRKIINSLVDLITLVYSAVFAYQGILRAIYVWNSGQMSPGLQIKMFWIIISIPIGYGLVTICALLRLINKLSGKEKEA